MKLCIPVNEGNNVMVLHQTKPGLWEIVSHNLGGEWNNETDDLGYTFSYISEDDPLDRVGEMEIWDWKSDHYSCLHVSQKIRWNGVILRNEYMIGEIEQIKEALKKVEVTLFDPQEV